MHGKMVTKYQFSPLLIKAWMATKIPANIRSWCIYPFNLVPLIVPLVVVLKTQLTILQGGAGDEMNEDGECIHSAEYSGTFSALRKNSYFKCNMRWDMIFLTIYLQWLNTYHPNAIPQDPEAP